MRISVLDYVRNRNEFGWLLRSVSCPPREKMMQPFAGHEELFDLYDFRASLDVSQWTDEADDWEDNDV